MYEAPGTGRGFRPGCRKPTGRCPPAGAGAAVWYKQNALDITLRRFAEYHNLEGAFTRRATIEQAKGILMERHGLTSEQAFELLRRESTDTGRKLIDLAQAVTDSHRLLPDRKAPKPPAP